MPDDIEAIIPKARIAPDAFSRVYSFQIISRKMHRVDINAHQQFRISFASRTAHLTF